MWQKSSNAKNSFIQNGDDVTIGDHMPDGSIYAGVSPHTGKKIYAQPDDAPLSMTFNDAAQYAKKLNREKYLGHHDWRVPRQDELNVLFKNSAAIGKFNVSDTGGPSWYWSAKRLIMWSAWGQQFSDGAQYTKYKVNLASVRCVR